MVRDERPIAVEVSNVSKDFKLPQEKTTSIKTGILNTLRGKHHKSTATQHALKNIDFTIREGEFFAICGRNGSGKSTLLKILAGIYQPTKGSVKTRGKLVPFIELGVGFNPELTGRENVYLNGAILGFSQKEVTEMYDSIVDFAELRPFMDQKLKNYSSGMEVRLAFSMAIRAQADILLIDEVLAVGDADFQRKCYKYFNHLRAIGKTVVFVSHDMDAVREYCTRAVLIDNQELIYEGSANQVAERYLKLMMPKDSAISREELDEDRWGDGTCTMSNVHCSVDDDNITLSYDVIANKDCPDAVFGYRIRNEKSQEMCGSNSVVLGNESKKMKKGDKVSVSFTIDNTLGDGTYFVDPSVIYEAMHTHADWWNGAAAINVVRMRHTHYPLNPRAKVSVKRSK